MPQEMEKVQALTRTQPARRKVLTTLHETGPIVDPSGRATSCLADAMGYTSRPVSLSPLLSMLEADGLVQREVRGRRCFLIELTAKGSALVDLYAGVDSRGIGDSEGGPRTCGYGRLGTEVSQPGRSQQATPAPGEVVDGLVDLLSRQLREVLMDLGALRHRVSELERRLASPGAPVEERPDGGSAGLVAGRRRMRSG